ncbi:TetR/AcrR family transcriptional regulator [Pseudomonas syringae]|uniref:TetR/AcrR family transcriptional regulator n=1 Tax=Pseudomonas syringae TaxID=317 RepID=UPI000CD202B3|nr:TetR/AcrR family transcriptional regulator [Pseudomonas syringae]MCF4984203.1 TetR family transcriptional regulator [Pseudomonas syringae]MCF5198608.1 TetR family transcriptional regulator [Pseudomonas syringae]MCF5205171.1 TetR family transcriptional regulator [Pseudomonas syringae]MCF5211143.1 TetR family transcriptional regulator [Pseudomonas syringae]MCF5213668.1 TetR family transcriptional regulator [Pseudomonas syringae]
MPDATRTHDCPAFLLEAACELMTEQGYGAMSMRQLAARVGLQPGSLYHHIASKQDLLLDVLLSILAQRLEAWQRGPYTRDLHGYLGFHMARQRSHPCEELLLRHESRHVNASHRVWLAQALGRLQAPLRDVIEQGVRSGQFNVQDIPSTVAAIFALIDTADGMRNQPIPVDEACIEAWIVRMSIALLSCSTAAEPPTL